VAAAATVLLSLLGVAIGAGGIHFTEAPASDLRSYGVGAGIWTAVSLILSMAFGGYVAARLSGTHSHLDGELHGITVWAVALLLTAGLLGQAAGGAIGTVATGAGSSVTSGSLADDLTPQTGRQALFDRAQDLLTSSGDLTQMTHEQIAREIATLTGRRLVNGTLTDQDRDRLSILVAAQTGITKEEAGRRVLRMEQDAQATLAQMDQQARAAADTTARNAARGARAIFSSLLLGLAAAMVGAWTGTRHARVLTPAHEPVYDTHTTTYVTHTGYDAPPAPTSLHQ
jgi:hypothetical protein